MSPGPDTHDSTSRSSTSVVMSTTGAGQPASSMREDAAAIENPYLAGLSRKTRGLKKKMEKIKKTETLSASGKVNL